MASSIPVIVMDRSGRPLIFLAVRGPPSTLEASQRALYILSQMDIGTPLPLVRQPVLLVGLPGPVVCAPSAAIPVGIQKGQMAQLLCRLALRYALDVQRKKLSRPSYICMNAYYEKVLFGSTGDHDPGEATSKAITDVIFIFSSR